MISKLHGIHDGMVIGIVGSSPTAIMYDGLCDVSIGVNGAAMLGRKFDYFLYGDKKSHLCDWFTIDCSDTRIGAKIVASMDKLIYPDLVDRFTVDAVHQNRVVLPEPKEPHLVYSYKKYEKGILARDSKVLYYGGTIAGCALQLAYLMGARHIKLYGCSFSHAGSHYFYNSNITGSISRSQLTSMRQMISEISNDTEVEIVGKSAL